jgi:hypothetical protein
MTGDEGPQAHHAQLRVNGLLPRAQFGPAGDSGPRGQPRGRGRSGPALTVRVHAPPGLVGVVKPTIGQVE